jgi:hypothetical protein
MVLPMRALLVSACVLSVPLLLLAEGKVTPFREASLDSMRSAVAREFRPVGSTSVVYRVRLADGAVIAFRPAQRSRPRGHLAELAAYRIARSLGMENVPPVVLRTEALARIDRLLDARFEEKHRLLRPKILASGRDVVGAAIHWVDELTPSKLDKPEQRERWLETLSVRGGSDELSGSLLRDLSQMVAFDYLIGNWDRMSGGNLQTDASGERVIVRDHNLAFDAPLLPRHEAPLLERLNRVERFSRTFVERLRALDDAALERALAPDPLESSRRLLDDAQLRGVKERRRAILARIDTLSAEHGERRVLAFE